MEDFDVSEYERWIEASRDELAQARILGEQGHHHGAVLHSEQAGQLLLKGLLRGVGAAGDARGHGLAFLADACVERAGLDLDAELRDRLADLALDYQPTRYPDAVAQGTPRQNYGAHQADRAFQTVERTMAAVTSAWQRLQDAARAATHEPSTRDDQTPSDEEAG